MLIINNVKLPLDYDFSDLTYAAARALKTDRKNIKSASLFRKSVDARHKNDVHFCCSLLVSTENDKRFEKNGAQLYSDTEYIWKKAGNTDIRPVVAGFGPAGMFAALALARAGMRPLVLERGQDVDTRIRDVESFFAGGALNTESNVQFGEGGAGTFSDGKLNTGIKDSRCREILKVFVSHGAPEKILTDAKPHIGTDILSGVVKSIRNEITALGGEVRFGARLDKINRKNGGVYSVTVGGDEIPCDTLILATGHSARDTFNMLIAEEFELIRKPFSVGVRIEHLQSDINRALYGDFADHPALSAADYKLSAHPDNRGVYTFCMCPGGEVINASSENGGIAVNGMSRSRRDGVNANSALLVSVLPEDIEGGGVLDGCEFQRKIEQAAYSIAGGGVLGGCEFQRKIEQAAYSIAGGGVPVSTVGAFVFGEKAEFTRVKPTVKPNPVISDFGDIFPEFVLSGLKNGIMFFDRKINGFADKSAVLTAPETRSSSPVRIVRNEELCSVSCRGVYPCGEGAGYAGGIMSAAADGLKTAEKIIENSNR